LNDITKIQEENLNKVASLSVQVETFSYLESILSKVEILSDLEEIKLAPKSDFMR
jgi:hypothetical protein